MFLQSIGEVECLIHRVLLEDVEATVQGDFPAGVRHNVAGMRRAGAVESPSEVNPGTGAGGNHGLTLT